MSPQRRTQRGDGPRVAVFSTGVVGYNLSSGTEPGAARSARSDGLRRSGELLRTPAGWKAIAQIGLPRWRTS
jgi:hypothetical protein